MGENHFFVDGFLGVVSKEIASFLLDNFEEFWKSKKERVRCRGGFWAVRESRGGHYFLGVDFLEGAGEF